MVPANNLSIGCAYPNTACAVQAFFAKWGDEGVVDLQEELSDLIILTASRTLLGVHCPRLLSAGISGPWVQGTPIL